MKIDLILEHAVVHKLKGVEYLDSNTRRNETSWRLILDIGDDTCEIRCTGDVAQLVKRNCMYTFVCQMDPGVSNPVLRIVSVRENHGYDFDGVDKDFSNALFGNITANISPAGQTPAASSGPSGASHTSEPAPSEVPAAASDDAAGTQDKDKGKAASKKG